MIKLEKDNKIIICNYNPKENGIYKITFITSERLRVYIGKTERTFDKRVKEHINACIKGCHKGSFQNAWNEATKIVIEVVERLDNREGVNYKKIETQWINTYEICNLVNDITSYADFFKKRNNASN